MNTPPTFADLGLSSAVLEALSRKGFEEPTPIQALVIPELLAAECDLIGQAQTGTGKTAAFALPLVERLVPGAGGVQALVLAPTRELAVQVCEEISSLRGTKPFSVAPVYGGQSYTEQFRRFKQGVDILVGTPGRILDHLERGTLKLDQLKYLILDEADEMLDMGFSEDIETLLSQVNPDRKMLLFSATMPDRIKVIANKYMKNPKMLTVKNTTLTVELTEQIYFEVNEGDKFESLCRILDLEEDFFGMVFCRTKIQTDELAHKLADRGYGSEALHGDLTQGQREQVLKKFKNKRINVLCATDVAARGIDVDGLTHVINYSLPQDPEAYVHRIGRTGRAGKEGTAVTFITPIEYRKLAFIERVSKTRIRKERVPGITEIITLKKNRLLAKITEAIGTEVKPAVGELAQELLEGREAQSVLSAVLQQYVADEFDESTYAPIRDLFDRPKRERSEYSGTAGFPGASGGFGHDRGGPPQRPFGGPPRFDGPRPFDDNGPGPAGKARLFIAMGRQDGLSPRKLVELLESQGGIPGRFIDDAAVMDDFSFVTVPFRDAERLIQAFRTQGQQGKPLIKLARPEDGQEAASPFKRPYTPKPYGKPRFDGPKGSKPWERK
jgi:ATP-dependent RNA helicase DeaD